MNDNRLNVLGRTVMSLSGILTLMLPMLLSTSASFAVSQADLQAQASLVSNEIANQSSEIHTFAVQETIAQGQLEGENQQLQAASNGLAKSEVRINSSKQLLREIALNQFTHQSGASVFVSLFTSTESQYTARIEYERVMGLNIDTAIMSYQAALSTQFKQVALVNAVRKATLDTTAQLENSRKQLSTLVVQEESTLSSLNSQIATIVQQQIAARIFAQLQAKKASSQQVQASQGIPSSSGISSVIFKGAGVGNWGGSPAPPSPQALAALRQCESDGNYSDNTGNGYYGAYQFSQSTWNHLGFSGLPSDAPPQVQDSAATMLAQGGWYSWPECALVLGLN